MVPSGAAPSTQARPLHLGPDRLRLGTFRSTAGLSRRRATREQQASCEVTRPGGRDLARRFGALAGREELPTPWPWSIPTPAWTADGLKGFHAQG